MTDVEHPDMEIAKRLLNQAQAQGFTVRHVDSEDGPLLLVRARDNYTDKITINGFSRGCWAIRERNTRFVIVGDGRTVLEIEGSALSVLNTVLTWP